MLKFEVYQEFSVYGQIMELVEDWWSSHLVEFIITFCIHCWHSYLSYLTFVSYRCKSLSPYMYYISFIAKICSTDPKVACFQSCSKTSSKYSLSCTIFITSTSMINISLRSWELQKNYHENLTTYWDQMKAWNIKEH